jgi:ribosome-associated protein
VLGVQLVALSAAQLAQLALPEALHEAVVAAQRMRSHGARTRQLQYIGKVMRQLDPTMLSRVRAALTPRRAVTPRP